MSAIKFEMLLFFAIDYIGENPRIVAEYQILC